jgi:hypothetical protein
MNNNQIFIFRERFTQKNKSRATIVGQVTEDGVLVISGAKCKAKNFMKRDGVKYAIERLNNEKPWIQVNVSGLSNPIVGTIFGSIARKVIKNIDNYYQVANEKVMA